MEQVSRMAAEVNKLIGRNLLDGKALYLPEIGSLYIVTTPQGTKSIDFSSSEQGSSIVEVIKERAACTPEQASEIFTRWIAEVRTSSAIVVEGVGELRGKTFVTLESFASKLNVESIKTEVMAKEEKKSAAPVVAVPSNKKETKATAPAPKAAAAPAPKADPEPKKSNNKAIIICVLIILALIGGYIGFEQGRKAKAEKEHITAIAQEKAAEQQRIADSIAVAQIEAKRLAEKAAAEAKVTPKYKVVYGVYELRSNVDVAIKKINKAYGEGTANEYPFAGFTMVTMFESDNRAECQKFLMENYDTYPDAWIDGPKQ